MDWKEPNDKSTRLGASQLEVDGQILGVAVVPPLALLSDLLVSSYYVVGFVLGNPQVDGGRV